MKKSSGYIYFNIQNYTRQLQGGGEYPPLTCKNAKNQARPPFHPRRGRHRRHTISETKKKKKIKKLKGNKKLKIEKIGLKSNFCSQNYV